jgi:hypothetical protein
MALFMGWICQRKIVKQGRLPHCKLTYGFSATNSSVVADLPYLRSPVITYQRNKIMQTFPWPEKNS